MYEHEFHILTDIFLYVKDPICGPGSADGADKKAFRYI